MKKKFIGAFILCSLMITFIVMGLMSMGTALIPIGVGVVLGTRDTTTGNQTIYTRDVMDIVPFIYRGQYPLTQFFLAKDMRQKVVKTKDSAFEHFEKQQITNNTTTTVAITGGSTTEALTVTADIFRINDVVIIEETGDWCDVSAVDTLSCTVRRIGGGNVTAYASTGATVRRLGTGFSDKYVKQTAMSNNADAGITGYNQISIEAIDMSGREQSAERFGDTEDWEGIFEETLFNMMFDDEQMFLLNGSATKETLSDGIRTHSAGFRGGITTNVDTYSGTIDMIDIDDFLEKIMIRGVRGVPNVRVAHAGNKYYRQLSQALKKEYNWTQDKKDKESAIISLYANLSKVGDDPEVLTYWSEFGQVIYVNNQCMEGKWSYNCLYTHPSLYRMRFQGDDTNGSRKYRLEENIQALGSGNRLDNIMTDKGLHIETEKLMGWHNKAT